MPPAVAVLGVPGSPLGERVFGASEGECFALDLDAPLRGCAVTVAPDSVAWQGVDLFALGAVLVERPVFPWPQPQDLHERPGNTPTERANADREARALALSALRVAARRTAVIDPPEVAHLAASPAAALDALGRAGLPVAPWELGPAPAADAPGELVLDAAGPERWHAGTRPPAGQPALVVRPPAGALARLLVVDGACLGARDLGGGARRDAGRAAAELAERAAAALGLGLAAVMVAHGEGADPVLAGVAAAPDLVDWDDALGGRVSPALARMLARRAEEGRRRA